MKDFAFNKFQVFIVVSLSLWSSRLLGKKKKTFLSFYCQTVSTQYIIIATFKYSKAVSTQHQNLVMKESLVYSELFTSLMFWHCISKPLETQTFANHIFEEYNHIVGMDLISAYIFMFSLYASSYCMRGIRCVKYEIESIENMNKGKNKNN